MWCELERARHTQQIIPMTRDELGVDAVACDVVQRPVGSGRVDAIEARVTKIRQAWAEAIAEQHEQAEDNVRIYMDVPGPGSCTLPRTYVRESEAAAYAGSTTPAGREHRV